MVYYVSVSLVRIISGGLCKSVGPGVNDRVTIDIFDTSDDPLLEFVF